ncbi:MAG: metallophosphoesterase [Sporolactobacillus sp.]
MLRTRTFAFPAAGRLIAISDVHGNLNGFKRLLKAMNYSPEDALVIVGDLCEKGPDSLGLLRFLIRLEQTHPQVYVLEGNCDHMVDYVFAGRPGMWRFLHDKPQSLLNAWLRERGKQLDDFSSLPALAAFYQTYDRAEIDWLSGLPTVYETDRYLFVHAGLEYRRDWRATDRHTALTLHHFNDQGHLCPKTVVVGHYPVVNYCARALCCHNPLIDQSQRIISIDGGNAVRVDGQLNALIIERTPSGCDRYETAYVDDFQRMVTVSRDVEPAYSASGSVCFPHYKVSPLNRGEDFTLCENPGLGVRQWIKNEYLILTKDGCCAREDVSTTMLRAAAGEQVAVVDDGCSGYVLVKLRGCVGWLPRNCLSVTTAAAAVQD